MSSLRRILSSRANGVLSQGPKTPQGKQRSAHNALRHGLLAQSLVFESESPEGFAAVLAGHLARLRPVDDFELGMVEEMVAAHWRLRRCWALETRMYEKQIAAQPAGSDLDRSADAFSSLAQAPAMALMHRYEARLHQMYQRSYRNLLLLRITELPNEPNPISEHPAALDPATPRSHTECV